MSERHQHIPSGEEILRREPKIRSSSQLAEALGFTCNPTEKKTTWFRTFEKPLPNTTLSVQRVNRQQELTGYATLEFQDVGRFEVKKEERIFVGVRWGEMPTFWQTSIKIEELGNLEAVREAFVRLQLQKGPRGDLDKTILKQREYQQLLPFLRELENIGFYRDLLHSMEHDILYGEELIRAVLIPKIREYLPAYRYTDDKYIETRSIYFFTDPERGRKTVPTIQCMVYPHAIGIIYGRGQITENGELDIDYFNTRGNPYTVAPPLESMPLDEVWSGWRYQPRNFDDARNVLNQALETVRQRK